MRALTLSACLVLLMCAGAAHAQWVDDGVPITAQAGTSERAVVVPDGAGGAIVVWDDYPLFDRNIYAQRVDAYGRPQWAANGIVVCDASDSQDSPYAITDGNGGAWVVWVDARNLNSDIYINHVDGSGALHWGTAGYAVCTQASLQLGPTLVSDGADGVVVVWDDWRSDFDIYAERVNRVTGKPWGVANGMPVCANGSARYPRAVFDGVADVFVVWQDGRDVFTNGEDVYIQKVSSYNGVGAWGFNGVAVCTDTLDQIFPQIVTDDAGGAIVVWDDYRSGIDRDIFAQRVDDSGGTYWVTDGAVACSTSGNQMLPKAIADGNGGAIITWNDYRNANYDIFAQRLDASGAQQWSVLGEVISTETSDQIFPWLISDEAGGAIIVFEDNSAWPKRVTAQRIDASGNALWSTGGEVLCDGVGNRERYSIATDGAGGAIVAWEDNRYGGSNDDIFVQQIAANGRVGFMAPDIESVRDVPGDQGGSVYLSWNACRLDRFEADEMSHYTIWRAISESAATAALERGEGLVTVPRIKGAAPGAIRVQQIAGLDYYWEYVAQQGCYYLDTYGMTAATLFDSTDVSNEMHYFQIIGHTFDPHLYWISSADSGYSVDNLPPATPKQLAGSYDAIMGVYDLIWLRNWEEDLAGYRVYRGDNAGFVPGTGNLVASPEDTTALVGPEGWPGTTWFKVSAIDEHGNESFFAVLGPDLVTDAQVPRETALSLSQNTPNPFNPSTSIAFSLDREQPVTLVVFDAKGRRVATLLDRVRTPGGAHEVTWHGKDRAGRGLPSGVYFYRLTAGARSITRKAVLLK